MKKLLLLLLLAAGLIALTLLIVLFMRKPPLGNKKNDAEKTLVATDKTPTSESEGKKQATGMEKLILAVEDDAAPWSMPDGTGYANDLVKALYEAVGVQVELEVYPYKRCKQLTIEGEAVGCFNMARIPELNETIMFPETPLFMEQISYFHNVERPLKLTKEKTLPQGALIGAVIGYEYSDQFYKLRENGTITVDETRSEDVNLKKLASGRLDAAILVYNKTKPAEMLIEEAGVTGKVAFALSGGVLELHIGFSKIHPRAKWALDKYQEGIKIIKANGAYERITNEWLEKALRQIEEMKKTAK